MLLMNGLRGLGDYSSTTPCSVIPAGDPYRTPSNNCTDSCGNLLDFNADGSVDLTEDPGCYDPSYAAPPTNAANPSSGAPWWQSLVTGITQGVVQPGSPKPPMLPIVPAQPWYATPTGMIGIGVGVIALIFLLRK